MNASDTNQDPAPLAQADPVLAAAAQRTFHDLSASIAGKEVTLADRAKLLNKLTKLGFDGVLSDPATDNEAWPDAGSILREQARYATPVDMAVLLILKNRELAIMDSAEPYQAGPAAWVDALDPVAIKGLNLARCLQATGAMQAALDLSITYAQDRVQFGRPLARFQAIQHELAVAAEQAAAANTACDLVLAAVGTSGLNSERVEALLQAASIVTGQAIGTVHRVSHQVHGAIGFTQEYFLSKLTLNLLRWRDEIAQLNKSDLACAQAFGDRVFKAESLWTFVTETSNAAPAA